MTRTVGRVESRRRGPGGTSRGAGGAAPGCREGTARRELGRGRSGVVYLDQDSGGRPLACKVFGAEGSTKLVQWLLLGAPNPYLWCEDAVRCAALRRELLAELVPLWLPGRCAVAAAHGWRWDAALGAHQLDTAFVAGRAPALRHPRRVDASEADELVRTIMRPLQERLVDAGFDGLVWQAGKGNPVALNNFLRLEDERGVSRWVWIDLESGVPALFPIDPRALLSFYLPQSLRRRRPLFDDVDTQRLVRHLDAHRQALGAVRHSRLIAAATELERRQGRWKALRRHECAIGYRLARGELDPPGAAFYRRRPLRWHAREASRAACRAPSALAGALAQAVRAVARLPLGRLVRRAACFLTSQRYRYALARRHVSRRIRAWERRGQLDARDARLLRDHLSTEESSAYLCDFGVHLALKPFVKAVELWLVPMLFVLGYVGEGTVALVLALGGAAARTVYTGARLTQAWLRDRERPWAALAVGTLPVVGNLAYPLQLAWSSTEDEDDLARFILYDGFGRLGELLPIWGGRDTLTEHALNRVPDRLVALGRQRPAAPARAQAPRPVRESDSR